VGANIGYYSNYFAPLVRRVYALEPAPFNLSALRRNAALCPNIAIIEKAISSRDGPMTNTLEPGPRDVIDVETMTIDSFVAKHADVNVGLVKTDTEGHDIEALAGMTRTVRRFQPLVLSECGCGCRPQTLLQSWQYRAFAYVCDRPSLKITFQEVNTQLLQSAWYKMFFLAPRHVDIAGVA
jgi:FkbM family methyltransferase